MEGRILSKVEDVESDGGTLAWHAIKFSDVSGVMDDDRQLSSDLEKHLRLNKDEPMEEQELMVRRGPDGHLVIKKENEGQPCAGHQGIGLGFGFNMPTNSSYTSSAYTSSAQHASGVSPLVRPESNNVPWAIPSNPGSWRHDDSMSSFDLEMDKEPSMTPFSQVMSPPNIQEYTKAGIDSHFGYRGDTDFNQKKYMHENNLRRYAGDESENATNQQHQLWQQNIQHQQAAVTPDTGGFEEIYTFELDEFGEGPLHTLSAVSDELTLRESIKMLQTCNVVKQCINLQNKLKQTPLFLSVLQKNTALINWLLENGADPNIQGTNKCDTLTDSYIYQNKCDTLTDSYIYQNKCDPLTDSCIYQNKCDPLTDSYIYQDKSDPLTDSCIYQTKRRQKDLWRNCQVNLEGKRGTVQRLVKFSRTLLGGNHKELG